MVEGWIRDVLEGYAKSLRGYNDGFTGPIKTDLANVSCRPLYTSFLVFDNLNPNFEFLFPVHNQG